MENETYTWETSANAEIWTHGEFETIEECVKDAKENYHMELGKKIAVGITEFYEISVDADRVLEDMEADAYDECGESAEGWNLSEPGKEAVNELTDQLTNCVKDWLKKYNNMPYFYRVVDIRKVVI
jgi:methylmalonyl-CoA mutase N-terminal domain/subunit